MCGAGDAGVVIANDSFGPEPQRLFRLIQSGVLKRGRNILLNSRLVLTGGWHNACADDIPFAVCFVFMPDHAARRFCVTIAGTRTCHYATGSVGFRMPGFCKSWILRYVEWVIGHRYDDIAPMNTACRVQCPILLVHGTADETVPVTDAQAIRNNCRGKKPELLLIEGGSHDSVEKVEQHGDELVAFLEKSGVI